MFPSLKSQMAIAAGAYLLLCSLLMGQVNTATILGSVTDASGAAIPGATIKVLNVGTQAAVSANSDTSGAYTMERLPSGIRRESPTDAIYEYLQAKSVWIDIAGSAPNPFVLR